MPQVGDGWSNNQGVYHMKQCRNGQERTATMKTTLHRSLTMLVLCGAAATLQAGVYNMTFSGVNLTVAGEYINAVPVAAANQEFAPKFLAGQTVTGAISYDTNQLDNDPSPNTGTYRIGSLFVNIPELNLTASRSSSSMQISAFNGLSNDEFFAYVNGVDSFSNTVGLPNPTSFWGALYGPTSMLVDDQLPTSPLNWNYGNVSFNFLASDATTRQVLLLFTPVPEPTAFTLIMVGLVGLAVRKHRSLTD